MCVFGKHDNVGKVNCFLFSFPAKFARPLSFFFKSDSARRTTIFLLPFSQFQDNFANCVPVTWFVSFFFPICCCCRGVRHLFRFLFSLARSNNTQQQLKGGGSMSLLRKLPRNNRTKNRATSLSVAIDFVTLLSPFEDNLLTKISKMDFFCSFKNRMPEGISRKKEQVQAWFRDWKTFYYLLISSGEKMCACKFNFFWTEIKMGARIECDNCRGLNPCPLASPFFFFFFFWFEASLGSASKAEFPVSLSNHVGFTPR